MKIVLRCIIFFVFVMQSELQQMAAFVSSLICVRLAWVNTHSFTHIYCNHTTNMHDKKPKTQRHSEDKTAKPSKIKAQYSQPPVATAHTFVHHYNSTLTVTQRQFSLHLFSSRPTSYLRCGQLEVRGHGTRSSAIAETAQVIIKISQ